MIAGIIAAIQFVIKLIMGQKPAIVKEGEGLGEQTQKVSDLQAQVKAETAVASAEANAPSTVAGVETRLNDGTF